MASRRSSLSLFAVLGVLAGMPSQAAVTTYTGTFSGTIAAGDTALLNDGASVSGNVANSGTLQFNISGSSAVADNAIISGTGLVRMTGSGTVSNLFDAQTYTGATRLENGTLLVNYNDRLGNTSSGVIFDGGELQITNSGVVSTFSTARSMSLVSAGTIDTSTLANGSYDQPAFTGPMSGAGTLTLAANGLGNGASDAYLRFGGTSTYSGTTRITSGVVYASSTTAFGSSTVVLDGGGLVAPAAVTANNAIVLAGTANSVRAWGSQTMNLGGAISGTGGLQKTDNGTVNLNAANTYTGDTRIVAGTLNAANYAALAETTLDMNSADAGSIGFTVAQTGTYQIGGLTGSRAINNGGDTLAIGGNGTSTTYSGTLSGAGGLIKAGGGTLTLTGSNSYSGGTELQAGTLALGSAGASGSTGTLSFTGGTLQYSASNTTDYSSRFSTAAGQDYAIDTNGQDVTYATWLQSAGGSLTKSGAGTLSLTGWANFPGSLERYVGYDGMDINVMSGTLSVVNYTMLVGGTKGGASLNVSGGVAVGNGFTATGLAYAAGSSGTATVTGGALVSSVVRTDYYGNGVLNVSGGEVLAPVLAGNSPGSAGTVLLSGGTLGTSSSFHGLGVQSTGSLTMTGGSLIGSQLRLGSSAGSQGIAAISGGTTTVGSLIVGQSGTGQLSLTDAGSVTVSSGTGGLNLGQSAGSTGVLNIGTGGAAGTLAAGLVTVGSGTVTVNFNHTGTTTFSPAITSDSGAYYRMTVNKLGAGTTILTGSNSYYGVTTISAGTLQVGNGGTSGSLGQGRVINNGVLVFNRSGTISTSTLESLMIGNGTVIQQGPGTLLLNWTNSGSGGTILQAGTLLFGISRSLDGTYGSPTLGSGTLALNGGTLGPSSNFVNVVIPNAVTVGGDVVFGVHPYSSGLVFTGTTDLGGGQRMLTTAYSSVTFNGNVTNGGLTKAGGLNLVLTNSNGYTGPTVVSGGTVSLQGAGDISSSSGVDLASGAALVVGSASGDRTLQMLTGSAGSFVDVGSRTLTVGNASSGTFAGGMVGSGGGLTKAGSGALTLSGSNSFTGQTTVSAGTLILNSSNALAPTAAVVVNSGATLQADQPIRIGYLDSAGTVVGGGNLTATLTVTRSGNIGGITNGTDGQGTFAAGIAKLGTGTSTVNASNTYTGLTWVREGTLAMGLSNAFTAASDLTVDSGATFDRAGFSQTVTNAVVNGGVGNSSAGGMLTVTGTLSGSGSVNGATLVNGVHAPGNSPGLQTFNGDLTYAVGAAVEWELASNTTGDPGTNYDQIVLPTGNLLFSGSTTLDLSFDGAGSTVAWSDPFWDSDRAWMVYDLGTGTTTGFASLVLGGSLLDSLGNALLETRGAFSTSLVGQDVFLSYTAVPIPEPSSYAMALAGLACGGYSLFRRRKRA